MPHPCNAYCRDGEHCDLVYTDRKAQPGHIAQVYGYRHGLRVLRCDPACEAPALASQQGYEILSGHKMVDERRWLVWWTD